jgi:RHS repeat-associated protein
MTKAVAAYMAMTFVIMLSGTADAQTSVTRTSSFTYDAASGLPTQEVVEPDTPTLRLQTGYTYDAFGNRVTVTVSGADIVSRGSSSSFDAKGQFATSNTNALGQSEHILYDLSFGQPTSQTGPNNLTTTWVYDSFGRKLQEMRLDGTLSKWRYQFCSGVYSGTATCPAGAKYLIQATPYAADQTTINGPTTLVYFDSLDREIANETQGFDGRTIRATTTYDALGRVSQTSQPYFLSGGTPQVTTLTYDALGRAITQTRPDGTGSQVAYHGQTVAKSNALGHTRSITKNSQGNVVSVTDALGKTMTYAYDPFGNLAKTTDAVLNEVTASYDLRGGKIASSDPDLGSWSYTYNTLGLLVSQTNAKGQTTTLTYDKLDRLVQKIEPDMTGVWVYDTTHGIGKLASSSVTAGPSNGFARSISYDAQGRPWQVATTIDGVTYTMGATYDADGRLAKVSYPSGFTAGYSYTARGDVSQLLDDATSQSYWTANAMDAEQHLLQQTVGNGLVTANSFEAATGRLTGIATGSGSAVQNLSFTYDHGGNPWTRGDANTGLSETFTYDALKRLTSSTVNLSPTKTFTYDEIGNLLSKSDVGTYSYPAPRSSLPHAVMGVSGGSISATFTYDQNGNQTSGLGRSIVYTSYNKPASITQGTRTISFLDDTDHQRFKQVTPEGTTLYISAFGVLAELSNPGTSSQKWTDYLSVGDAQVGMRVLQTASATLSTRYFHTDHLDSISVITNESGAVVERLSYDPWGKRRFPNGADDPTGSITSQSTRGFTGEEELSVSSLVHLNGRVYDPVLARMTSADPTVPDALSAQSWNGYSYVVNRPLKFIDPTGFDYDYVGPDGVGRIVITGGSYDYGNGYGSGAACCVNPNGYYSPSPSLSDQIANFNASVAAQSLQNVANINAASVAFSASLAASNAAAFQASMQPFMPTPSFVPTAQVTTVSPAPNSVGQVAQSTINATIPGAQHVGMAQQAFAAGNYGAGILYLGESFLDAGLAVFTLGMSTRVGAAVRAANSADTVILNNGWRTLDGKFASPLSSARPGGSAEVGVWDAIAAKPGWSVRTGPVAVRDASGQLRYYDGVAFSPRDRVIGLEVKSGGASRNAAQRTFDRTLNSSPSNVANGVGQSTGVIVRRSTVIRVP